MIQTLQTWPQNTGHRCVVLASAMLLAACQPVWANDQAADTSCVRTTRSAPDRHETKNQCAGPMSVAYCRADRPLFGKQCGQQASKDQHQPFYTHLRVLKPGESMLSFGDMRFAVCAGEIAAANGTVGRLDSKPDGSFTCWPAPQGASDVKAGSAGQQGPTTEMSATGKDLTETCKLAQTPPSDSLSQPSACTCAPLHSSTKVVVYQCKVTFRGSVPEGVQTQLKQKIREQLKTLEEQHCAEQPQDPGCKPGTQRNGGPGVRG